MNQIITFYKITFIFIALFFCSAVQAKTPEFTIKIKNHLFVPSELIIPANTKIKLVIFNLDDTAEEFESYELNREKIIMAGQRAIIFISPLEPGNYPFFGEFNPKTAQGMIIVRGEEK